MSKLAVRTARPLDRKALARLENEFYLPGETVTLNPRTRFAGETEADQANRVALFGTKKMLILATVVGDVPDGSGDVTVDYVFQNFQGSFNAKAFMDPRGYENVFGALIRRDGATWLVPFDGDASEVNGPARKIAPDMPRAGRHCLGINEEDFTLEQFWASHEAEPAIGEWILHPNADGSWALGYSPWMGNTSADEVAKAEAAVAEVTASTAPEPGL